MADEKSIIEDGIDGPLAAFDTRLAGMAPEAPDADDLMAAGFDEDDKAQMKKRDAAIAQAAAATHFRRAGWSDDDEEAGRHVAIQAVINEQIRQRNVMRDAEERLANALVGRADEFLPPSADEPGYTAVAPKVPVVERVERRLSRAALRAAEAAAKAPPPTLDDRIKMAAEAAKARKLAAMRARNGL
jgi:hypothetical protein